jgi:outer membrane protein assembly factor BamB
VENDFDPESGKNKERSALFWHFGGWNFQPKTKRDFLFGRTMSTCAIHEGLIYIGELAGYVNCLDARTGERYWIHDTKSAIWGSAYYVDSKVYVPTEDGDVFVFAHGKEKKLLAKVEMEASIKGSVVVVNGVLFIKTENTLYAIETDK